MTIKLSQLKFDCSYFKFSKPCKPHKDYGVVCGECSYYNKTDFKILIIKFAADGDVLRTTSILPALKNKYPNSQIFWITSVSAAPVFSNNPFIDKVLVRPEEYLSLINIIKFDQVYALESDFFSSSLAANVQAAEKYGYLLDGNGYVKPANEAAEEWFLMGINDDLKKQNSKDFFQHLYSLSNLDHEIQKPEIYLNKNETEFGHLFYVQNNLSIYKKILGINTGSGKRWQLKKWTLENYISLLELVHEKFPEVGLILFGGPEEVEFNESLKNKLSFEVIDAGTKNSLRNFFALVNLVNILFTPDSLAFHIGVALRKTVICYTGPTSYNELSVFGNGEIIHSDLDCLVCYLNKCGKPINCMNSLKPDFVLNKISQYL
jgi:heptosyltransferase-2